MRQEHQILLSWVAKVISFEPIPLSFSFTVPLRLEIVHKIQILHETTVVDDYIITIKTTFEFNFDFNKAFKQHESTKNGN